MVEGLLALDKRWPKNWVAKQILEESSHLLKRQGLGCDLGMSIRGKGKDVSLVENNSGTLNYFGKFMSE